MYAILAKSIPLSCFLENRESSNKDRFQRKYIRVTSRPVKGNVVVLGPRVVFATMTMQKINNDRELYSILHTLTYTLAYIQTYTRLHIHLRTYLHIHMHITYIPTCMHTCAYIQGFCNGTRR